MKRPLIFIITSFCLVFMISLIRSKGKDLDKIKKRLIPKIKKELEEKDLEFGSKVFIRIFKEEKILEIWLQEKEKKPSDFLRVFQFVIIQDI